MQLKMAISQQRMCAISGFILVLSVIIKYIQTIIIPEQSHPAREMSLQQLRAVGL